MTFAHTSGTAGALRAGCAPAGAAPAERQHAAPAAASPGAVRRHRDPALPEGGHRERSIHALATRLAALRGEAPPAPAGAGDGSGYVVPDATLLAREAQALGLTGEDDLYGGVVPTRVVAGKSITHPLAAHDAPHAPGWSAAFTRAVAACVLPGRAAFTRADAARAAHHLLPLGAVRLKPAWADGGRAQRVVRTEREAADAVERLAAGPLSVCGLVLEHDLSDVVTFSVGRVSVGATEMAYAGTQSLTTDNTGAGAYGGSRLLVVRGGFDALAKAPLPEALARAVVHARRYDAAANQHFPGFFASRRNYDVALGRDAQGRSRAGVLEQSWRIGGASGAEIAALTAFAADPALTSLVASCHEVYGAAANPPPEADIYYHADDPEVGPLTKYALVRRRRHA